MSITAVPLRPVTKGMLAKLWVGIGVLAVVGIGGAAYGTQKFVAAARPAEAVLAANAKDKSIVVTPSGLQYKVLTAGKGPHPTPADVALINYEGRLADGKVFDASAQHGGPAQLPVAGLIPGFSEALTLMPVGARYRVWIPPELGYGPEGAGDGAIPPNALLIFDIEMLGIAKHEPTGAAPPR